MPMDAGDETIQPGTMARTIYDALVAAFGAGTDPVLTANRAKGSAAIAQGVVNHLQGNIDAAPRCRAASTGNIASLSGELTIDGVGLNTGDIVLVKNQTTPSQNGPYVVSSVSWTRLAISLVPAMLFTVSEGTANADSLWVLTTNAPINVGTTALTFASKGSNDQAMLDHMAAVNPHGTTVASLVSGTLAELNAVISDANVANAVHSHDFASITSKPTTLVGYGITDAASDAELAAHTGAASGAHAASAIAFTPVGGIAASTVQAALAELDTEKAAASHTQAFSTITGTPTTLAGYGITDAATDAELAAHTGDTSGAHAASAISFAATADIVATDAQAAIVEARADAIAAASSALSGHTGAASGAHAASAISFAPTADIVATTVQAAITEVRADAIAADATSLATHTGDATAAHAASAIAFTPTGSIAASDVQAAIVEVASDAAAAYALVGHNHNSTYLALTGGALTGSLSARGSITAQEAPGTGLTSFVFAEEGGAVQYELRWDQTSGTVKVLRYSSGTPVADPIEFGLVGGYDGIHLHGKVISGVPTPVFESDAVPKSYADQAVAIGSVAKFNARVASTGNVNLASAPTTLDGVTLGLNERILLKDQTAPAENGLYWFPGAGVSMAPARTVDLSTNGAANNGAIVYVEEGTVNAKRVYALTTTGSITLGTTGLTFERIAGVDTAAHPGVATGAHAASAISFSPTGAVAATTVQAAIAELDTEKSSTSHTHTFASITSKPTTLAGYGITDGATDAELADHTGDASGAHAASAISFTPAGSIAASTVQAAIEEVAAEAAAAYVAKTGAGAQSIDNQLTVGGVFVVKETAGQGGAAIVISDESDVIQGVFRWDQASDTLIFSRYNAAGNAVEGELVMSATDLTFNGATILGVASHTTDPTDAHDASAISFVPTGSIAATDVQAAVAEVASERVTICAASISRTASQSIPNATGTTIDFDASEFSIGTSAPTVDTTNNRIQINATGYYLVTAQLGISFAGFSTGEMLVSVLLNGSTELVFGRHSLDTVVDPCITASRIVSLASGDLLTMSVYQSTGAARNTFAAASRCPRISVVRVG